MDQRDSHRNSAPGPVLVTGAAGFIGSHVCDRLLRRGQSVVGLDNFDPFYARRVKERNLAWARLQEGFRLVEMDLLDSPAVSSLVEEVSPSAVIHLAAKAGVRPSIEDPSAYVAANVAALVHLLEAARRLPAPLTQFLFASSSSVYGDRADPPFRESDSTDFPASPYAATKKAGEALCYTYHRLYGIPITCLRFFTVYGPRQRPDLAIHKFVRLIEAEKPIPFFGDGSTARDYTYVDDTVDGILAALDRPTGYAVYNLGRSDPVTLSDLVRGLEAATGKRATLDRLPDQPGDVRITCADTSLARKELGYAPQIDLEEGLRRFIAWFREVP